MDVDYIPFPLGPNYQEVLEWQEILRGLGLVYALSEAILYDRILRNHLRRLAGSKTKREIKRRDRRMNPDPIGIPAPPPAPKSESMLARVRASIPLVQERLDIYLERDAQSMVTALGAPSLEAMIHDVWITSREGRKLHKLLGQLSQEVELVKTHAHSILKKLRKVRPALNLVSEVQALRRFYQSTKPPTDQTTQSGAGSYRIPQEVLDVTYHDLIKIESAVMSFVEVCYTHQDEITRLKGAGSPDGDDDRSMMTDLDFSNNLRAFEASYSSFTATSYNSQLHNPEDSFLQRMYAEDRAVGQAKREARAWISRRCGAVSELCDVLEDYYDSARDAFSNLGIVRESDMARKDEIPVGADTGVRA